jgi:LysM repeat protein
VNWPRGNVARGLKPRATWETTLRMPVGTRALHSVASPRGGAFSEASCPGHGALVFAAVFPKLRRMRLWLTIGSVVLAGASTVLAQSPQANVAFEIANLREDLRLLQQQVGELKLTVEQLTRENSQLQARASQSYVTVEQLNRSVADVNRTMQSALSDQKREVLQQVAGQIERLGKQTNAALDSLAKGQATRPTVQTEFSEDFPREGVTYTVQTGDTLSKIAERNNARVQDIINANKISDPTKLRVGQSLFIPQRK